MAVVGGTKQPELWLAKLLEAPSVKSINENIKIAWFQKKASSGNIWTFIWAEHSDSIVAGSVIGEVIFTQKGPKQVF